MNEPSIIITGASTGIGRELALRLAARGARLTLAARDGAALDRVAAECVEAGGRAFGVSTDVGTPEACARLVDQTVGAYGALDVLVNNAGISMRTRFEDITDLSLFESLMRVNYLGAVYCTHYALPHLKRSRGLLVAVSSLTGKTGVPTRTGYAASKHAMQGFFDSLRIELRGTGVDVLVVSPGFVETGIRSRALGADGKAIGKGGKGESRAMTVEYCAREIELAIERRARELILPKKLGYALIIKALAPSIIDRVAARSVRQQG